MLLCGAVMVLIKFLNKMPILAVVCSVGAHDFASASPTLRRDQIRKTLVVSAGVNRSFDSKLPNVHHAIGGAREFASALAGRCAPSTSGLDSCAHQAQAIVLEQARGEDFQKAIAQNDSAGEPFDLLVVYFSGISNDHGLHFSDQLLTRDRLARMIASSPAKRKVVIIDEMSAQAVRPTKAKTSLSHTLPLQDEKGQPILWMISEVDQPSAYERLGEGAPVLTRIFLSAAARTPNQDGPQEVRWNATVASLERTLRFMPDISSGGRRKFDISHTQDNLVFMVYPREVQQQVEQPTSTSLHPTLSARSWAHAATPYEPTLVLANRAGYREGESYGMSLGLRAMAFRSVMLSGFWKIPVGVSTHQHEYSTDQSLGHATYTTFESGIAGQYDFSWGWQDLRPYLLVGQLMGKQRLTNRRNEGAAISNEIYAPIISYGIASHFYLSGFGVHLGPFYRSEIVKGNDAASNWKGNFIGLELAAGDLDG